MNEFDFKKSERARFESMVDTLMMNASSISFGECAISLKIHNGSICSICYTQTENTRTDFKKTKNRSEENIFYG